MKPDKKEGTKGSKKGKGAKKKAKKDPNEPPKPVSAYASFFRDTQGAIKGQNPDATFGEVSKIVASMWDSLDIEKKKEYKDKADEAKKDYIKVLAAYRASKAALEEPEVIELEPSEETDEYSHSSPVAPSSPQASFSSKIVKTVTMTRSESLTDMEPDEVKDENSIEIIEPSNEEEEASEEGKNQPKNSSGESSDCISITKVKPDEQNGPHLVNGIITIVEPEMPICVRTGCTNRAIESLEWDREFCSSECVVEHCNNAFLAHRAQRQKKAEENVA